jgi:hypothetical protein
MATQAEIIRALEKLVIAIEERQRLAQKTQDDLVPQARDMDRRLAELDKALALVSQRLEDHLKRVEIWDSRRWGLVIAVLLAIFGSALSFAGGIIVALAKKP